MPGTPVALELLTIAENKTRPLSTNERRHVITWMMATSYHVDNGSSFSMTNDQMANLFNVSERTIRKDKLFFRQQKAKFIKEDDIGLVIADIALNFEKQFRDIEKSKNKSQMGTMTYLKHCTEALALQVKAIQALQDLGYYPKNLGQLSVTTWDFKSHVDRATGYVTTEKTTDAFPVEEGEIVESKKLTNGEDSSTAVESAQYEFIIDETEDYSSGETSTTSGTSETI